jgi:hypothetical protein
MQMARANVKGGGIGSRVVKEVGYRTGKPATRISPGGASQIGESVGNKATDSNRMLRKSADPVREGSFPAGSIDAVKLGAAGTAQVSLTQIFNGPDCQRNPTSTAHWTNQSATWFGGMSPHLALSLREAAQCQNGQCRGKSRGARFQLAHRPASQS